MGGPGKAGAVVREFLVCPCWYEGSVMATLSNFCTTGLISSTWGAGATGSSETAIWCCGSIFLTPFTKWSASSFVQKYISTVCNLYMYLFSFRGSNVGRCHSWESAGMPLFR